VSTSDPMTEIAQDSEDQALDFLEQWLSAAAPETPNPPAEAPRSLDPGLRAIERLVTQHRDLFQRHAQGHK